jgi:ABC-type glycerol-3-phosphate transport system substrate-binding protein
LAGSKKITAFGRDQNRHHEEQWKRTPNTTGQGAIHVKTFHSKLTADALDYLDNTINEWLDEHPQYEVKFVTSTVGILTGKLKEPHLICQIWV